MTAPLVFMDTETTGLEPDADIWEFAGIRREPDGTETELHLFIEHDEQKCRNLPASFRRDHLARFPAHDAATTRERAAALIAKFLKADPEHGRAHIVGAVPNFDTERLAKLLDWHGTPWHYHLIDVENLAVGALAALPVTYALGAGDPGPLSNRPVSRVLAAAPVAEISRGDFGPPWDSDEISRAIGVEPPTDERHTAMGDARWAMAIYDRVMGVRP